MAMIHVFFIAIIIYLFCITYATFFHDLAKKHWEHENFFGFMPEDLKQYRQVFKIMIVITLLLIVAFYICIITGLI